MTRTSNNFKLFLTPLLTYNFNPILSNCLGNFGPPKYPNIGQHLFTYSHTQTTDTQRRHKSKKLKIWADVADKIRFGPS